MSVPNNYNSKTTKVTIYSPDGEAVTATRMNANDLVRYNGYSWKTSDEPILDAKNAITRIEDEAFAQSKKARGLEDADAPAQVVVDEPVVDAVAEDANIAVEIDDDFDPETSPLADVAERLNGTRKIADYLERFTADQLRELAEKRYDERIHARTSKANTIDKIVDWETEKNGV